jgi:hypothetical protein
MSRAVKSQCQLSDDEFASVLRLFTETPRLTIQEVEERLGCAVNRARELLIVVADICDVEKRRGGRINVWALSPDAEARIAARHVAQRQRLERRRLSPRLAAVQRLAAHVSSTWQGTSAAPHHYPTDGMGRVIGYTGPTAADRRWSLTDDADLGAASG